MVVNWAACSAEDLALAVAPGFGAGAVEARCGILSAAGAVDVAGVEARAVDLVGALAADLVAAGLVASSVVADDLDTVATVAMVDTVASLVVRSAGVTLAKGWVAAAWVSTAGVAGVAGVVDIVAACLVVLDLAAGAKAGWLSKTAVKRLAQCPVLMASIARGVAHFRRPTAVVVHATEIHRARVRSQQTRGGG